MWERGSRLGRPEGKGWACKYPGGMFQLEGIAGAQAIRTGSQQGCLEGPKGAIDAGAERRGEGMCGEEREAGPELQNLG